MRRILALVLTLCLCFAALAGCADSGGTTSPTESGSAAATGSAPTAAQPPQGGDTGSNAGDSDFVWNGNKEVWSVLPTTNAEGLVMINDFMGALLEADGWIYSKKDAMLDPTAQVSFVEDAIASGRVGALMVAAMSVEMLQTSIEEATAAGIIVVYLGAQPTAYDINGCVYTAYELTGMWAVEVAESWVKQNIDNLATNAEGKVPVALDVYEEIQDGQYRSNAMRGRTEESDVLYIYNENQSYGENATTVAYNWAENMMTANPDLRVFVCYEPEAMIGVCDYLEQYAAEKGLDLADFCVVCCYEDATTREFYSNAVADPSSTAFKGYVTYGDAGDVAAYGEAASMQATGAKLAEEIMGAADGTWAWNLTYYDTINAYSTFEGGYTNTWVNGQTNPAEKYKG